MSDGHNRPVLLFMLGLAAFVVVVAGMRAAESLLVPFLLSLFIAVICSPPLLWMKSRGMPGGLAVLLMILLIVLMGAIIGAVVGSSIASFRADLPEYQARLQEMSGGLRGWLASRGLEIDRGFWAENVKPSAALALAGNTLSSLGNLMTNAFLILLTVIFILAEEMRFADRLARAHEDMQSTINGINRFTKAVNHYMALKSGLSLATGALVSLWLWFLGVDYALLWGTMAFLLNFVPNLGSLLAAVPAVLLALVQLGVPDALWTAAGYVAINLLIGNVVEPKVMGRGLNLSTLVVFLSLVFWGWVLGPVGMLLSVPLTMTVKIALESYPGTAWLGMVLGDVPPEGQSLADSPIMALVVAADESTKGSSADS
ncbi:AI-2E family transporter [Simiduia aestuariiviva]|uniref:Putative PurR-regulated permease PerM n=1 Tax=Simiduia aestuariiviva TaxID=1510459 RepID=A0A839UNK7_9GAMM|nr:AI-2E family transporter [Simiduia aestuariiviva]MBB3169422.1 putative PurR-regulated permease PerM [Simiduia aestuariiviva]